MTLFHDHTLHKTRSQTDDGIRKLQKAPKIWWTTMKFSYLFTKFSYSCWGSIFPFGPVLCFSSSLGPRSPWARMSKGRWLDKKKRCQVYMTSDHSNRIYDMIRMDGVLAISEAQRRKGSHKVGHLSEMPTPNVRHSRVFLHGEYSVFGLCWVAPPL